MSAHPPLPDTISEAVLRLLAVAARLGYTVDLVSGVPQRGPGPAAGRVEYDVRTIWVDPSETGVTQALILLHELGHALAADRMGYGQASRRSASSLRRCRTGEERAYLYGWAVAVHAGLAGPGGITRNLWRAFNEMGPQPAGEGP